MLNPLYTLIASVLEFWHGMWSKVFASDSGAAWGLAIAFLTITVRVVLFPLFVKQIKSQRAMQVLQPKVKELQIKYKDDKQTLQVELMKLYKENNANPVAGCLPILLQMPVFLSLFTVVRKFQPDRVGDLYGIPAQLVREGANAKVFGAPITASFTSSAARMTELGANGTTVKIVSLVMIVLMGASTFYTQKQLMARTKVTDPQQIMVQRIMLYVLPLSFAVFGVNFPVGVLLYWLTTNLWSMGQQAYVIRTMPDPNAAPVAAGARAPGVPLGKTLSAGTAAAATAGGPPGLPAASSPGSTEPPAPRSSSADRRPTNQSRAKRKRKGGRR